jgi:hypothetical protein
MSTEELGGSPPEVEPTLRELGQRNEKLHEELGRLLAENAELRNMRDALRISRHVLPLSSGNRVPPNVPIRIIGLPKNGPLTLEALMISSAGTPGGARDWIINDIEVDDVSQLSVKDLPGELFRTRGVAADDKKHATARIHFNGLDVIEHDSKAVVTVTYVGPNPEGVPFYASIVGAYPKQRPTVLPIDSAGPIKTKATIQARLDAPLRIELLEIDCGNDGADWTVHDVRVDGASAVVQPSSPIPGAMFSTRAIDTLVTFAPGTNVEIDVQYVGNVPAGIPFIGRILGTVVRDDYDQPPPDVQVLLSVANHSTAQRYTTMVEAKCNWRTPYVKPAEPTAP